MKQNDNNNSGGDNKEMEQLTEEFDEKVNFIQNEDDDHHSTSDNNNKEVENIFNQVNDHQARRPSLQLDLDTQPEQTQKQKQQAEIPFDFNRFLEQMKSRSAKPITRYFKSFLQAFDRRPWTVNEQIKIIQDFLDFIYVKMRENDIWKDMSDQEFCNAKEGMEKLVMNRLYSATFCSRTTDDKERDEILYQKISIFRWIRERHLDIPETEHNDAFFTFAQSGLIKQVEGEAGADKFLPILIYVIIRANPPRLVSNTQYIYRFRNIDQLQAESGYYLTNLMGAIAFIETMDDKSLSITKEEFDSHIEQTMNELKKERPSITLDKEKISYESALHPSRSSPSISTQSLLDSSKAANLLEKGSLLAQKTMQKPLSFVGKLFQGLTEDEEESSPPLPPRPSYNDQDLQTLYNMFPNIDPTVCYLVLNANQGVLANSIENLLEISNQQQHR
ncbi:hypothetical protein G6F37_006476 [Rhizopus arrhizus]|nr:hypothetical protein G6F38_006540 [Rhizopus arrhizus]KAG1157694.1 hypothetical protein G6F37_006476 [Rhizopus arrhizus]